MKWSHFDDVDMLLRSGESAHEIARRLRIKPDSVGRNLHRHGHTETARQFWALAQRERSQA